MNIDPLNDPEIKRYIGEERAEWVIVTPEMAKKWLGANLENRNVRSGTVNMYARDIENDRWKITGEAIKFGKDGKMKDGQHRCKGIIKANTPVPSLVVTNLENDSQEVMDSGAKRSAGDSLKFRGFPYPNDLAAGARVILAAVEDKFTDTRNNSSKTATNSEIYDFVENNPSFVDAVKLSAGWRNKAGFPMSNAVISVATWTLMKIDADACYQFFNSMVENSTNGTGDPRNTLLKRVQAAAAAKERIHQDAQFSMIYRAWNAWRAGKSMKYMRIYNPDESVISAPVPK